MKQKNDNVSVVNDLKPKIKQKRKKGVRQKTKGCWEICKKCLLDETDYVHICLKDSFVTCLELKRMIGK